MISRKFLRSEINLLKESLKKRGIDIDINSLLQLDEEIRNIKTEIDGLREKRNKFSQEVGKLKREGKNPENLIQEARKIGEIIKEKENLYSLREIELTDRLSEIPNIPHPSVPYGKGSEDNPVVREWGEKRKFDFKPLPHWELGERLNILDFQRAVQISGSRFVLYKGLGAQLERALIQFFLELHTREHKYTEVLPPVLVRDKSAYGSAHLPKFDAEMFKTKDENMYLIPTAETFLANLHRDEILREEDLPLKYVSHTLCFRREAGSYGKDVRGMIRVHQFNKVELFKFTQPEDSYDGLEKMREDAERVLQLLKIPYRVLILCTGDMGFASAKTYDIEAWAPGLERWLEVSSISNCEDFQARRTMTRFRNKSGKVSYVHTLNGSGVALPRTYIAIIENYQEKDGSIRIPEVLIPYMNGVERIG